MRTQTNNNQNNNQNLAHSSACLDRKVSQQSKSDQNDSQNKIKSRYKYEIQDANNFKYYSKFKCILSQLPKYLIVQFVLQFSMTYFYILTFLNDDFISLQLNIVIIFVHILVSVVFIALAFINPGIIPKIHKQYQLKYQKDIPFRYSSHAINDDDQFIIYSLPIKSHHINLKYCQQCLIFKPPRTVHCWTCNACIEKMDHHCPFIGNCVGKGNYSFFFIFVSGTLTLTTMMIAQICNMIVQFAKKNDIQQRVSFWFCFPLLLISFVAFCFVGSLLSFHIYLIINSLTTNQFCKKSWTMVAGNPFSKNFCGKNILKFIIGPSNRKKLRPSVIVDARQRNKFDKKSYMSESDQLDPSSYQQKQKQSKNISPQKAKHQTTGPTKSSVLKIDKQRKNSSKDLQTSQKNLNQQSKQHL